MWTVLGTWPNQSRWSSANYTTGVPHITICFRLLIFIDIQCCATVRSWAHSQSLEHWTKPCDTFVPNKLCPLVCVQVAINSQAIDCAPIEVSERMVWRID